MKEKLTHTKISEYFKDRLKKGKDFVCIVYGPKGKGMSHDPLREDDENNSFFDTLEIMEKKRR
jgi:hypothetical protein